MGCKTDEPLAFFSLKSIKRLVHIEMSQAFQHDDINMGILF